MKVKFILTLMILLGCKTAQINTVESVKEEVNEVITIDKNLERYVIHDYDLYKFNKGEFIGIDTFLTFENERGIEISQGNFAINKANEISRLKTGLHKTNYSTGKIKSEGEYRIGSYLNCCAGGPCQQYYNYKVGNWKYYHESSKIKAIVKYSVKRFGIDTSCEKGDTIKFGAIENIQLFDEDGTAQKVTETDLNEFETVKTEEGEYTILSYYIDNDKVRWKLSN